MELEALEGRRLLSASVSEGYPGFYYIDGDDSPDEISVSVSMTEDTFSFDGNTYSDVSYIVVHGGGGDDTISVMSVDGPGPIGASITGDDGNDVITLNFDGGVWAGSGNDVLHLSDSFRGQALGEEGDDQIFISGDCIDPEIHGGPGDDLIDCSGNNYGVVIHGDNGNDTIYGSTYDDQIYGDRGNNVLYGGGGHDFFDDQDSSSNTPVGGSGEDTVLGGSGGVDLLQIDGVHPG